MQSTFLYNTKSVMLKNKIKNINRIRKKIKNGKASIGTWLQIPDSNVAEIFSHLNYDWIAIDTEHSNFSNDNGYIIFENIFLQRYYFASFKLL